MRNSAHDTYHVSNDKTSIDLSHSHSKALSHSTCDGQMFQHPVEVRTLSISTVREVKTLNVWGLVWGFFHFVWFGLVLVCFYQQRTVDFSLIQKQTKNYI